jgi:hypothetical protein
MSSSDKVDIIIPLSTESIYNNDELKICLRSIDRYAEDVGRIIICTTSCPTWISENVEVVNIPDSEKHLKDANIINKVLTAISAKNITGKFSFFSDDQCLLKSIKLAELPPVFNSRGKEHFKKSSSRWYKRVYNTFSFLESKNIILTHNYESHTPQTYDANKLVNVMKGIDYRNQPGFTINTLFMGLLGVTDGIKQNEVKLTIENKKDMIDNLPKDKYFCGYNDEGFNSGLRELLFKEFSEPCKYEK